MTRSLPTRAASSAPRALSGTAERFGQSSVSCQGLVLIEIPKMPQLQLRATPGRWSHRFSDRSQVLDARRRCETGSRQYDWSTLFSVFVVNLDSCQPSIPPKLLWSRVRSWSIPSLDASRDMGAGHRHRATPGVLEAIAMPRFWSSGTDVTIPPAALSDSLC